MKRENGTGSIYKLKGKRRKPYVLSVSVWDENHTIRKRKIIGTYKTRKEAESSRYAIINSPYSIETIVHNNSSTFLDCATESLKRAETTLNESTLRSYEGCLQLLKPIWEIPMKDFNGELYQRLVDNLISKGIKAKRMSNVNIVTRRAVKVALRKGILTYDPTIGTDIGGAVRKPDRIRKPFSYDELKILWSRTSDGMAREILMMIYLGLRIDEYLSITSERVDLESRTVSVLESKTKAGVREMPIADCIFPFVVDHLEKYGKLSEHNTYSPFTKWFKRYLSNLGMDHIPHETRHTFATLLDEARLPDGNRIDITVAKVLIGHKVSDITKGTYTHENHRRLSEAINSLWCG